MPESNAQGTDGPFASLERARQAVGALKGRPSTKGVVVLIRGGIYHLSETVVFGLEDSGKGDSTVTYAAYHGEEAVFCSDVEISCWKRPDTALTGLPEAARGKVWVADVPKVNGAPWRFFTLYDAEGRLQRARSTGFVPLPGGKKNVLHFPDDTLKSWPNLEDVEVVIHPHHAWVVNILPLASVNEETQVAHTAIPGTYRPVQSRLTRHALNCSISKKAIIRCSST